MLGLAIFVMYMYDILTFLFLFDLLQHKQHGHIYFVLCKVEQLILLVFVIVTIEQLLVVLVVDTGRHSSRLNSHEQTHMSLTSFLLIMHLQHYLWTSMPILCFLLCCSSNLEWNHIPAAIKVSPSLDSFKRHLKTLFYLSIFFSPPSDSPAPLI